MVQCPYCKKRVEKGQNRNGRQATFCSDRCRKMYHKSKEFDKFVEELGALVKKYRSLFTLSSFEAWFGRMERSANQPGGEDAIPTA